MIDGKKLYIEAQIRTLGLLINKAKKFHDVIGELQLKHLQQEFKNQLVKTEVKK